MQCESRGNVERYKAKFVTKVLVKEKKEHIGYHNSKLFMDWRNPWDGGI